MNNEKRWKQRFENFEKSFEVFCRRQKEYAENQNVEVYQMALIKSFELIFELSWKTLKDYLESQGVNCGTSPKNIIRHSFSEEIILSPEEWLKSLEIRNKTSHTYKKDILEEVTDFINKDFYSLVRDLYHNLKKEKDS